MSGDALSHLERPAAGEPEGMLVLFHGRGADERDLYPLLDVLDPDRRLVGVTPRGPLYLPPGGAHWYAVREIGYPDPDTFTSTYALATAWLDGLVEAHGLTFDQVVLGGFSQGAVMTYALSLGEGRPRPAAIVALSGFVPTVPGFALDLRPRFPPITIGHGALDTVISVEWGRHARELLERAGARVEYHEAPYLGHTIDPELVRTLPRWVQQALDRSGA